ncbi:MAG TPA: hypothetical protein VMF58_02070 [Rhizomicrobium sp.]|nr:hypothetical protein [Rhizomicrobium sp.]
MKTILATAAIVLPLLLSADAGAYVFGGTNFSFSGYPDPFCTKPTKPFDLSDQFLVQQYNNDVDTYVRCVKEYLDNADNDRKRILEKENDLIARAKSDY